jgi:hypothetical protein
MCDDPSAKDVILSAAAAQSRPSHRGVAAAEGSKTAAATPPAEAHRQPRTQP